MDNFPAQASDNTSNNTLVISEKDQKIKKTKNLLKKILLFTVGLVVIVLIILLGWFVFKQYFVIDNSQNKNQIKTVFQIKNEFIKDGGLYDKTGYFIHFKGEVIKIDNNTLTLSGGGQTYTIATEEPFAYTEILLTSPEVVYFNEVKNQKKEILLAKLHKGDLVDILAFNDSGKQKIAKIALFVLKKE